MNDINKLFEEMEKAEQENFVEELGLSEKELQDHKENSRLRKLMYLMMEGVSVAARMTGDKVLEELCIQRCQPFWSLISKQERGAMRRRNLSEERIGMSTPEKWAHDFEDSELGKQIWNMFMNQDGGLLEIQNEHKEHVAHLENRIETLEAAVMKIGEKLTLQAPPEEKK